ncbi:MAG: rRNA adenine N-6-methyltransferase family protein, partial [Christensenellaceae bacterium]
MASIRHKKSLGQHFLEDAAILQAIVEGAGIGRQDAVLEIGPGSGNLSGYLAARAARLVAVEI